jgi:hypothetical protein
MTRVQRSDLMEATLTQLLNLKPSRSLDCLVATCTGYEREDVHGRKFFDALQRFGTAAMGDADTAESWGVPNYTTSLDDALSLVPVGHHYSLSGYTPNARRSEQHVSAFIQGFGTETAATLPMAISALMVRRHMRMNAHGAAAAMQEPPPDQLPRIVGDLLLRVQKLEGAQPPQDS